MHYLAFTSCREGREIDEFEVLEGHAKDGDGGPFT